MLCTCSFAQRAPGPVNQFLAQCLFDDVPVPACLQDSPTAASVYDATPAAQDHMAVHYSFMKQILVGFALLVLERAVLLLTVFVHLPKAAVLWHVRSHISHHAAPMTACTPTDDCDQADCHGHSHATFTLSCMGTLTQTYAPCRRSKRLRPMQMSTSPNQQWQQMGTLHLMLLVNAWYI